MPSPQNKTVTERDQIIDRMTEAYARELANLLQQVVSKLPTDQTAEMLSITTQDLMDLLRDAGYTDLVAHLEEEAGRLMSASAGYLSQESSVPFGSIDEVAIGTAQAHHQRLVNDFEQYAYEAVGRLRGEVLAHVIAGKGQREIEREIGPFISEDMNKVETAVTTAIAAFDQQASNVLAEELNFGWYEYMGPLDKLTRPFCRRVLEQGPDPPVYPIGEIKTMKNGQMKNAFTNRGGYNCRHRWVPVRMRRGAED